MTLLACVRVRSLPNKQSVFNAFSSHLRVITERESAQEGKGGKQMCEVSDVRVTN